MKIENHEKQCLATLKRLKRDDDNELKRNLRLEKGKQLWLAVEREEAQKIVIFRILVPRFLQPFSLRFVMEYGERQGKLEKKKWGTGTTARARMRKVSNRRSEKNIPAMLTVFEVQSFLSFTQAFYIAILLIVCR